MKKLLSLVALTALMSAPIVSAGYHRSEDTTTTEEGIVKGRSCGSCKTSCKTCVKKERTCGSCNTCSSCGDRARGTVKGRHAKHTTATKHRTHKGSYKA